MSNGKTVWEMFRDRLKGDPSIAFYNPLDQLAGVSLPINSPQYEGYDFTITEIREYNRKIGGKTFIFTDYVLQGVKGMDSNTAIVLRLRVVPTESGGKDYLLMRLYDSIEYSQDLENVVRDTTGEFQVTYGEGELDGSGESRKDGDTELYSRIGGVLSSYKANVLILTKFDSEGLAIVKDPKGAEVEYWDYFREIDRGSTKVPQFIFVEMDTTTGWFQIWQGEYYYL